MIHLFICEIIGYLAALEEMPIAVKTEDAKTQHYELPTSFFKLVLGKNFKYRYQSLHFFQILIQDCIK